MGRHETIYVGEETLLALSARLAAVDSGAAIDLVVPDPEIFDRQAVEGELLTVGSKLRRYRSFKSWLEFAERLGYRLGTPRRYDDENVAITLQPIDRQRDWHASSRGEEPTEKYGTGSLYARMDKLEEPNFALDLCPALSIAHPKPGARALILGVNDGRELPAFDHAFGDAARAMHFHGVDHCRTAIERARELYPDSRFRFEEADIAALVGSDTLGQYDLILSVGTLQSSNLKLKPTVQALVRRHVAPGGCIVLGFPNCRQIDGEYVYGSKMLNFSEPEMSNLIGDVNFCKRYLQQQKRIF